MTDYDYPPSTTWTLKSALDEVTQRLEADDKDGSESHRDALQWAVDQFGAEAEITLQAFTANQRDRTLDTANRTTMGPLGTSELRTWLVTTGIETAPWLDGKMDLADRKEATGGLPPSLVDWLDTQLEELNDLSEGN